MNLVISGTNKTNSNTLLIAREYYNRLSAKDPDTQFLSLEDLSYDFIVPTMYDRHSDTVEKTQSKYFNDTNKFIFILPEYNGSLPGILKLLIDGLDVKKAFHNKKAALVGVATGRAGNLRGMDHLTGILQHMRVTVMPGSLPISKVEDLMNEGGKIIHEPTSRALDTHIQRLLEF